MSTRTRAKKKQTDRKGSVPRRKPRPGGRPPSHAEQLKKLRDWFLPHDGIFASLKRHGNTTWQPASLVWLALCWAWAEARNVTDAFETAAAQCRVMGLAPLGTYQGFMNALARWTDPLLRLLWPVLHRRMREIGGSFWRIGGWVPIAFDGSRSTAPRTTSAERAFCASNYGQGLTTRYRRKKTKGLRRRRNERHKPQPQEPQVWITLMWHMGLRLVRVGANVSLLQDLNGSLRKNGQVLCWPKTAQAAGQPPLRLRLARVKIGRTWMWMLTSVLDPRQLSLERMVEFYELRWGIEVEFRGLKQTLDRARLRCRNHRRLLAELHWSLMAMAVAELFALKEQLRRPRRVIPAGSLTGDPCKRSLARTLRALRFSLNHLPSVPAPGRDLPARLRQAVTDDYVRRSSKRTRQSGNSPPTNGKNSKPSNPRNVLYKMLHGVAYRG